MSRPILKEKYCAEQETCASRTIFETYGSIIRIAPKKVGTGSIFRHFLHSSEISNIVEGLDGGREPTVETENLILDHSSERNVVEKVGEHGPGRLAAKLLHAFIVEAVDLGDPARLVVSPGKVDAFGVPHLEGH